MFEEIVEKVAFILISLIFLAIAMVFWQKCHEEHYKEEYCKSKNEASYESKNETENETNYVITVENGEEKNVYKVNMKQEAP